MVALLGLPIGQSKYFKWREALLLREWGIVAIPEDKEIYDNIMLVAEALGEIREILGVPVHIRSWWRPLKYNEMIGGASKSSHILGLAVDFVCVNINCDIIRATLLPHLKRLNIRMENLPGSSWVHIDKNCDENTPDERRFFKP